MDVEVQNFSEYIEICMVDKVDAEGKGVEVFFPSARKALRIATGASGSQLLINPHDFPNCSPFVAFIVCSFDCV